MSRDVSKQFADPRLVAFCVSSDAWPRGLLSQTLIPDAWIGLVEARDGRRRLAPAGEDPRPERDERVTLVRNRPLVVPLEVADCVAAGGNDVRCAADLLLRWQARDDDLAALGRALLAEGALTLDRLAQQVADAGAARAVQQFVRGRPADELTRGDQRESLCQALREALQRFLFESGATLERVATLRFESESLRLAEARERDSQRRIAQIQSRELVEHAALAATHKRLSGLGEVLAKLRAAAQGDANARWHDLLPALSPAERGRLLENLWRITPDARVADAIVAVCGGECLWIDAGGGEVTRRAAPPTDLGGLRSVGHAPEVGWLLVGAATGVWALDAASGAVVGRFSAMDARPVSTGFNAAVVAGGRVYATHSQLGCWSWAADDAEDVLPLFQPADGGAGSVRAATVAGDGAVLFAVEAAIWHCDPRSGEATEISRGDARISAMTALDTTLYVACEDGRLSRLDLNEPPVLHTAHQASTAAESIVARRWNDLIELVVPAGAQGVVGVYADAGVVAPLLQCAVPLRRAWAADNVVVALTDARDKLIVANGERAERAGVEVALARLTGRSIQDACLIVRAAQGQSA